MCIEPRAMNFVVVLGLPEIATKPVTQCKNVAMKQSQNAGTIGTPM